MVVGLGVVSLFADMVADGGKALYGPLLGGLGASALVVGLVAGAAEATSLLLRLASGPLADRSGQHWRWTIVGYGVTAVCIPLLAVTPFLGAAGLAVAAALIIAERAGKALRSPSKTALLAHAAGAVGRGRGFGVHKALDLTGAFAGPLLAAAVLAATGELWSAYLALVTPGAVTMVLLAWLRRRVPEPAARTSSPPDTAWAQSLGRGLPRDFFVFAAAVGLTTGGLVSYAVISFHLARTGLVTLPVVPLAFAVAMAAGAGAAFLSGVLYDRRGGRVLLALPVFVAAVPPLALNGHLVWMWAGMLCWGCATGIQDSTIKALVADLVPTPRRATAYGVFAAFQGGAALLGGVAIGALYGVSLTAVSAAVALAQALAFTLLLTVRRGAPRSAE